jgi:hypothetical protein
MHSSFPLSQNLNALGYGLIVFLRGSTLGIQTHAYYLVSLVAMASPVVGVLLTGYAAVFQGTRSDASKALRQFASVKTSKIVSLKAGRKPSVLMWKTRLCAKSLTQWEYLHFNGKKQTMSTN